MNTLNNWLDETRKEYKRVMSKLDDLDKKSKTPIIGFFYTNKWINVLNKEYNPISELYEKLLEIKGEYLDETISLNKEIVAEKREVIKLLSFIQNLFRE